MRKVVISNSVIDKIGVLRDYLVSELKLSEDAAMRRIDRIGGFLSSLNAPADYPLPLQKMAHAWVSLRRI